MTRQRTAVVSGGTVGIGRGIVDRLLADNYIVYTFSRTDSRVEELKKAYASSPALTVIKGDVKDPALHSRLSEEIMQKHGSLDVLVNSAGIMTATGYIEEPLSAWREVLETNLLAPVALIQALYPLLQKGNTPSIINITSVCGLQAYPTCSSTSYSVSKAALEALTQRLAYGLGPDGIRVNNVAPGVIDTPMWSAAKEKQATVTKQRHILQGMLGQPEDIASAVAYLASPESRLITGTTITVDAGYHLA